MAGANAKPSELIDVRSAAALVGRHPETVRRWVWSGRLAARRQGNRLLMARDDVEALAESQSRALDTLAAWADRAAAARKRGGVRRPGSSAADLVLEDRRQRSRPVDIGAGR